jgi:hypothetical protein
MLAVTLLMLCLLFLRWDETESLGTEAASETIVSAPDDR